MAKKLLLNQAKNLESDKSNMTIPIEVNTNKEIIVDDHFEEVVNQYDMYLDEREKCTTIRLTANVNIIASNVIFNSVTEIVKYEGSKNCVCLNFTPRTISTTIGKPKNYKWGGEGKDICQAVMDTQISYGGDDEKNYTYLCGIDILNNHILRAKTKYPIIYSNFDDLYRDDYNTISDVYRDCFGAKPNKYLSYYNPHSTLYRCVHRYTKSNIMTFDESLRNNLINNNGWIGFYNKGLMISKSGTTENLINGVENVINNETRNKFIDLFPGRDRYSFLPHYNKYRKRYEKNWEYCLTYPCDSITDNIPFINKNLDTLKIAFIDETEPNDDGVYRCTIYTVSKHGLNVGDVINLYRSKYEHDENSEIVEENIIVDEVIDEYVFTVYTSDWVCKKWVSVFDKNGLDYYQIKHIGGSIYKIKISDTKEIRLNSINNYLNIDFDDDNHIGSQNLSFAKVVDNVQCKYYVRIFSRFPNFDFCDNELTEEYIYSKGIIDFYSTRKYEKQSTETRLGFSKNAYGDNIGQIVFNDDINIDLIKDNLGRPLTSLYLTFFKTNYGYKEWYSGKNETGKGPGDENVEWSRCFGKLNCGFEYSPYIDDEVWKRGNVRVMNNVNNIPGLDESRFYGEDNGDEIKYKEQNKFYGDLCMYSPSECLETVIQDCCHRFNTAQREVGGDTITYNKAYLFKEVYYDDIVNDDNEYHPDISKDFFYVSHSIYDNMGNAHPEGYFYHPNYEIPIRSLSSNIHEFNPNMIDVVEFGVKNDNGEITAREIRAKTVVENYFNNDTNLYLYNSKTGKEYQCEIKNVLDTNVVEFKCPSYSGELSSYVCKLYNKNIIIPPYAEIIPGKTGSYRWRDIIQNGFEDGDDTIKEYPFVNGCFYVNKDINIFLRRQDPFGEYGLSSESIYFGLPQITGEKNPVENGTAVNVNDAIKESDIKC